MSVKYDVVYVIKNNYKGDELRYSLRSVCENFPYNKIWIYGGKPAHIVPDKLVIFRQLGSYRWDRTFNSIRKVCQNNEITENFWLFNDDFFIMKPFKEQNYYDGTLKDYYWKIKKKTKRQRDSLYMKALLNTSRVLSSKGLPTLNYDVHMPMLINREKALVVMKLFPSIHPHFRSVYGNYWKIDAEERSDCKVERSDSVPEDLDLLSTSDFTFKSKVGKFIKDSFSNPCKYER